MSKDNKRVIANELYAKITAEDYVMSFKNTRQEFMHIATTQLGWSKGCASTYHHNAKRLANGGQFYDEVVEKPKDKKFGDLGGMPSFLIRPTILED